MKNFFRKHRILVALLSGVILGMFWLIGVRYVSFQSDDVHHHANFALYINGERDTFDSFTFYEEVQSCAADEQLNPKTRVHMHDQINHVMHVHDAGVTWGHFFANLGYTLGNDVLATDTDTYVADDKDELVFILNGEKVNTIANTPIRSEDALIVYFQDSDGDIANMMADPVEAAQGHYDELEKDAAEYNTRQDPSSCSGGKPLSFTERLKEAVGIF